MSIDVRHHVTARVMNILLYGGITTLEQAADAGPVKLLTLPGFGKLSLAEVELAMKREGLEFAKSKWQRENPTYASLKDKLREITDERDALRARIESSPVVELQGKRVALVVME